MPLNRTAQYIVLLATAGTSRRVRGRVIRQQVRSKKVYPIEKGLDSVETHKQYRWQLDTFLKWLGGVKYHGAVIPDSKLLEIDSHKLGELIIEYLDKYLYKEKGLRHGSINTAMAAIIHFCTINDVWLNTKRISKLGLPRNEGHKQDDAYTREQIAKLLDESDPRFKVAILLLANGMRVGALPELEIGDLEPRSFGPNGEILNDDSGSDKLYKIWVYGRSKNHKYYTFVTPECRKTIDDYIYQFRKDSGEDTNIKTAPLIREQFNINSRDDAANPRKITAGTIKKYIERTIKRAGIKTTGSVMRTHGFRKFAITMMVESDVNFDVQEYLVGHKISRGLNRNYERLHENVKLKQWSKAINKLTINEAFHLQKELKLIQGETNQKIAQLETHNAKLETVLKVKDEEYKALWKMQREQNAVIEELKEKFGSGIKEKEHKRLGLDRVGIIEDCGDEI